MKSKNTSQGLENREARLAPKSKTPRVVRMADLVGVRLAKNKRDRDMYARAKQNGAKWLKNKIARKKTYLREYSRRPSVIARMKLSVAKWRRAHKRPKGKRPKELTIPILVEMDGESKFSKKLPIADRFWSKVDKGSKNECWEWRGHRFKNGYGCFGVGIAPNVVKMTAQRVAYVLNGGVLKDFEFALHSCDNPPCCNPSHIHPGTHKQNMQECIARNRRPKTTWVTGENNGRAKLTEGDVREIRSLRGKEMRISLAARFGVTEMAIYSIWVGKLWRHVN